jgi:lysophospholipase L1-like esterase
MKSILCYGDSNTWGTIPGTRHDRLPFNVRWVGVLQNTLGGEYSIIEEGLSGRTTSRDDPFEDGRNGLTYLMPCLRSHRPLDLVVLMVGTNDLKYRFAYTAHDIARGAAVLVGIIQQSQCGPGNQRLPVLLVCPPALGTMGAYTEEFLGGVEKSQRLADFYLQRARELGCEFLDAGSLISSSSMDGVHIDPAGHEKLGKAIASQILRMNL